MTVCVFFGTFVRTDVPGDIVGGANFTTYSPFSADTEGVKWLIVSGGGMVLRKVWDLPPYRAVIEVVSPDICPGLNVLAQDNTHMGVLKLIRKEFRNKDLDGADFIVAAMSEPDLNGRISALCHSERIPVNVVDVKEEYFFILPSVVRNGPAVMGTSTGGMDPVIAKYLKARTQSVMPDNLGEPTVWLGSYRETVKDLFPDSPQVRSALFYKLAEEGFSHNGYLAQKQARIIIDRKLGRKHK